MAFPNTKIKDAAETLDVSEAFLRQLIKKNLIPHYKLSPRVTRLDMEELKDHMRVIAGGESD